MTETESVMGGGLSPENKNKVDRIEELLSEKESAYHAALDAAINDTAQQVSIKRNIQKAALALEEIYKLHGQGDTFIIQEIAGIIVKDLKIRGFPESKYLYVYRALEEYDDRFIRPIDHSSIQSLDKSSNQIEHFYRINAKRYYDSLDVLKELEDDYDNLLRRDIQDIVAKILDRYNDNEKRCKIDRIPISITTPKGFDGGPEKYQDTIRIQKPIPRVPESLKAELEIWIKSFLPALIQKFTEYPINDPKVEKGMTAGWTAIRHMFDPVNDDKYREMFPDWIDIVAFADSSFKHHAASHFKSKDWRGLPRKLTREQIGARQKTIPMWCKWFFECIPGFLETMSWFRTDKKMYLSGFSIDLSPKLSDRSIK